MRIVLPVNGNIGLGIILLKMRGNLFLYILLSFYFLSYSSCFKEEFTKPASVRFEFRMQSDINSGMFVKFNDGSFVFNAIEFDGRREAGGDVFFVAPFEEPIRADLGSGTINRPVEFDIPQGIYNRIKIGFHVDGIEEEPKIVLNGIYKNVRGREIPVVIQVNFDDVIEINAKSESGANEIILKREVPVVAEISFDPISMFVLVNSRILEGAFLVDIDGVSTLLISENFNVSIYDLLINRVERSFEAVFR